MNQHTLDELKSRITGEVITPDNAQYETLRNTYAQTGSPALIVRCHTNEDIIAAVQFARDNLLKLSVRSGGHSISGMSTNEGGLVIDLSHFNTVEVLDAEQHTVRIGTGAKWGEAAEALAAHGLALSSGDTKSVGVGGLTLGGGIGWLVRKDGLTIDNLLAADIITADGRSLRVSAEEHRDLFWAIRGGGGNFGIVTSFEFRAHPLKEVVGGTISYSPGESESVLRKWAAYMRTAPEELNSTLVLFPGFGPTFPAQIMIYVCYAGDDEAVANQAIKPLQELGTVQQQNVAKMPYYKMLEEAHPPAGVKSVSNTGFVKTLNEEVLAALAANYGRAGTPVVQVRSLGGAMARVNPQATAFAHRDYEAFILAAALVPVDMPREQAEQIRQAAWSPLKPFAHGGYVNFMTDAGETSIAAAYPPETYARLASVKAQYDPDNLFNQNHNIKPAPVLTPQ